MAYLRDFNRPKLETVGEALECIRQVLEVRYSYCLPVYSR